MKVRLVFIQLPNGKNAPCQSADFNTDTRECQIYLTAMPPSGNGTINPNPAVNHYEKMCVDGTFTNTYHNLNSVIMDFI